MRILAFETSCDDTAVAIVENGTTVLSNIRNSQPDHAAWGGVVPELAARLHNENWRHTLEQCLRQANLTLDQIDALAVTKGPGLQTSLLTGTTVASFLSLIHHKPLIPVQHILGHISSTVLDRSARDIQFPALVLTVSGGHTSFFLYQSFTDVTLLGQTLDDACGEAFDKCAKMLGLGYPGGPIVSTRAQAGDRTKYQFPRIFLTKDSLDFSFSGLKAALYREIETYKKNNHSEASVATQPLSETFINDVCASFEAAVSDTFLKKISRALDRFPAIRQVHFVGGVSANTFLRKNFREFLAKRDIELLIPQDFAYCTDNAAMIGAAAYFLAQADPGIVQPQFIGPAARLPL